MNARQFFDLVAEMRKWQKTYFAERENLDAKRYALNKSKQFERAVDMEIERVTQILNGKPEGDKQPQQTQLQFDNN